MINGIKEVKPTCGIGTLVGHITLEGTVLEIDIYKNIDATYTMNVNRSLISVQDYDDAILKIKELGFIIKHIEYNDNGLDRMITVKF